MSAGAVCHLLHLVLRTLPCWSCVSSAGEFRYPTKEQQGLFFRHYLADPSSDSTPTAQLTPEQLDQLSAEANVWALASHIFWGVWAIIQVGRAGRT